MRLPLSDDTLQQLVIGLQKPDAVSHDVTYNRLGFSFSFGGIPVVVQMKQDGPHRNGQSVRLEGYQSFTGPVDPETEDPVASRGIAPVEDHDEKYIFYLFKTAVNTAERADQPIEFQIYSRARGGRETTNSHEGRLPNPGSRAETAEELDAYGFDLSGEMFWFYPICHPTDIGQVYAVQKYVVSKSEPESVYAEGLDVVADQPLLAANTPRDVLPEIRGDTGFFNNIVTTAVTVGGDDEQFGQSSLTTFVDESDELEFEADHDALV